MGYRIEYFKEGGLRGSLTGSTLESAKAVLSKVGADLDVDLVRIVDADGIEIYSERFDA